MPLKVNPPVNLPPLPVGADTYIDKLKKITKLSVLEVKDLSGQQLLDLICQQQAMIALLTAKTSALALIVDKGAFDIRYAEELDVQVKALEQVMSVTGWDKEGNPLLDLKKWRQKVVQKETKPV